MAVHWREILSPRRRKVVVTAGGAAAGLAVFCVVFIAPLPAKVRAYQRDLATLEQELTAAREVIVAARGLERTCHLLRRKEVSTAIDEITKAGKAFDIAFASISPQEVETAPEVSCRRMPIHMELEAGYKELGAFLGALENLRESVVTVRRFSIRREETVLPRVKSELSVDVYLTAEE